MTKKKSSTPKREPIDIDNALRSWATLQVTIGQMSMEELNAALEKEKAGKRRQTLLARLATRIVTLTRQSQIEELMQ